MKKVLLLLSVGLFSCAKEEVQPKPIERVETVETVQNTPIKNVSTPDTTIEDTIVIDSKQFYFRSRLDDSITYEFNSFWNGSNRIISYYPFYIDVQVKDTAAVKDSSYTNNYLTRNTDCPIKIQHTVKLVDGSFATPGIGSTSTQLHYLEVFDVDSNYCSVRYSCDWYFTHWRDTYKNSNGTLEGEILNIPLK
jgi:hypothetical protein